MSQEKQLKRKDAYICPELHATITEVRAGTPLGAKVPPLIHCPVCGEPAQSLRYRVNQELHANIEWYRPNPDELKAMQLNMKNDEVAAMNDYLNKGMLLSKVKKDKQETEIIR